MSRRLLGRPAVLGGSFGLRPVAVCLGSQAIAAGGFAMRVGSILVGRRSTNTADLCTFVSLGSLFMWVG